MTTIKVYIERHPALAYFVLVFTISWGGLLAVVGGPGGLRATAEQYEMLFPLALLTTFAGPPIAGVLLTGLLYRRAGLRDLLARLTKLRVGAGWYALAILLAPLLCLGILLALSLASPEYRPGIFATGDRVYLLLFGISWGLIGGGVLEETGWTGFAVPALRRRHGILATGLIVGLLWGLWHLPITFWVMSGSSSEPLALSGFVAAFAVFHFAVLPAYRVLLVWTYDRTESLPVTMLMHASYSASRIILNPLALAGVAVVTYDLVSAAALWLIVAAVMASRGQLSRPLARTVG